jgi:hypothetical protein
MASSNGKPVGEKPAALITQAAFERKLEHGYAGRCGEGGMDPAGERGDVWWLTNERGATVLYYGYIAEEQA